MVAEVVEVGAVDHHGEAPALSLGEGDAVELGLAVEAPVDRVLGVVRVVDLIRVDGDVGHADLRREGGGGLSLGDREGRGQGGEPEGAVAKSDVGGLQDERAVDAARKADQHRSGVAHPGIEGVELGLHG